MQLNRITAWSSSLPLMCVPFSAFWQRWAHVILAHIALLSNKSSHNPVQMCRSLCKCADQTELLLPHAQFKQVSSWHVRPSKTWISLCTCPVWSGSLMGTLGSQGPNTSTSEKFKLWSDCGRAGWFESSPCTLITWHHVWEWYNAMQ